MSEYWVSHKKYFCKYCNIYIADDAPSRRQHETGLRHKGNVERFVRNLYKTGEKRKQDLEEEKREMLRIERAAQAAFAQDVGAGLVKPGGSSPQSPASKEAGPSKPARSTDPYANYTTAASLGYADPDEARIKAEQERRSKEGIVGAWEVVEVVDTPPAQQESNEEVEEQKPDPTALAESNRKREAEAPPDDEDTRQFKLRKKKLGVGLGEIYDPGLIPIKVKKKEEPTASVLQDGHSSSAAGSSSSTLPGNPMATPLPKWTARGWAKPGEVSMAEGPGQNTSEPSTGEAEPAATSDATPDSSTTTPHSSSDVKGESAETSVKTEVDGAVKAEDAESSIPSTGGLFKKRKIPAGSAGSRGRRI